MVNVGDDAPELSLVPSEALRVAGILLSSARKETCLRRASSTHKNSVQTFQLLLLLPFLP